MARKLLSSYLNPTPRILLFYFAAFTLLAASAVSSIGFVLYNPVWLITGCIIWVIWFLVIFIAIMPGTDNALSHRLNQLKQGALIIFITLLTLGLIEILTLTVLLPRLMPGENSPGNFGFLMENFKSVTQYNDGTVLIQQAAENLLDGKNPYAHANVVEALLKYNGSPYRVTPLRVGQLASVFPYPGPAQSMQVWEEALKTPSSPPPELESRICYPAGSFLLPAPFLLAGIKDIRIVYAIFVLAGLAYAVWRVPKRHRLVFTGVVLISLELWNCILSGETGSLCFPLLLVAWLALNRNFWLSAVLMGLAVTTKQIAWFFIPFYLIWMFRTQGMKKLLSGAVIIAGIFAILNLPFILMDPGLWFASIMSPMTDPMFPLGSGLVTLATSGLVNIRSPLLFTALEGISIIIASLWYFHNCQRYPQTGPILAVTPLFFAWRSLWSYFFYVAIITLAYILANGLSEKAVQPQAMATPVAGKSRISFLQTP